MGKSRGSRGPPFEPEAVERLDDAGAGPLVSALPPRTVDTVGTRAEGPGPLSTERHRNVADAAIDPKATTARMTLAQEGQR